jgi:hypothetical protein
MDMKVNRWLEGCCGVVVRRERDLQQWELKQLLRLTLAPSSGLASRRPE